MANPTTYFGWVMPNSADLVTDLPADFNVFGQGVDTSMQYLLGGTTGQVLSKTSGTNMAFTWVAPTSGDVTGVTAGTGITVTDPTGPVPTVTNSMATAYTTKGDLVPATGSAAFSRLGIGANNTILTADSAEATGMKWAAASGSAKTYTLVNSGGTTLSGSSTSVTGLSSYDDLLVIVSGASFTASGQGLYMTVNSVTSASSYTRYGQRNSFPTVYTADNGGQFNTATGTEIQLASMASDAASSMSGGIAISGCRGSGVKPMQVTFGATTGGGSGQEHVSYNGVVNATTVISSIQIIGISATFDAGKVFVYGAV